VSSLAPLEHPVVNIKIAARKKVPLKASGEIKSLRTLILLFSLEGD
jgi:hypothetical protein